MVTKITTALLGFFFFISCQERKGSQDDYEKLSTDSFILKEEHNYRGCMLKHTYYNATDTTRIDSVKVYYPESKVLESIEYRPDYERVSNKWIYVIQYYKTGNVRSILYNYKNIHCGDTAVITMHPSGTISSVNIYMKDSVDYPIAYESFHPNGIVARKGKLNVVNHERVPVGVWQSYDTVGVLLRVENFTYLIEGYAYYKEIEYFNNGNPMSEKYFEIGGEENGFNESLENIGTWKYYNEAGGLIRTEKHSDFIP